MSGSCGATGVACAEEVADARGGGDADAEGDGVHYLVGGHYDGLRGKRDGAEAAGCERDDFKGPPFGADVDDSHGGEFGECAHVVEAGEGPAAPAFGAVDEAGVED